MRRLICVDTQVLIWGIKEQASPGQKNMVPRAKAFLDGESEDTFIMVPSVVVGEFLMRVPPRLHPAVLNLMERGFVLPPYDVKAASIFSELWQARSADGTIEDLKTSGELRSKIKADCQIVATAIAQEADVLISHDDGVAKFAGQRVLVREIPTGSEQIELAMDQEYEL